MDDLWEMLGYGDVASRIVTGLEASARLQVISGPPGVGKSSLARRIGEEWVAQGGVTLEAEGDRGQQVSDYYPFRRLSSLSRPLSKVGPLALSVVAVGESFLGTRGGISSTITALTALAKGRRRGSAAYLGEAEQQILHRIEQLGRKKPILLIADNLHWWDEKSLDLLRRLREPGLRSTYPVLGAMRVIAVETTDQGIVSPRAHDDLLAASQASRHQLPQIPSELFAGVLRSLGAPESLPMDTVDAIYRLSGGHLSLADRAAQYTASRGIENPLPVGNPDDFMRALLFERVHAAGRLDRQTLELLKIAATLGLEFPRTEILCASDEPEREVSRLLRVCRDERLLFVDDSWCKFAHDLLRQYFKSLDEDASVGIHERLMSCARLLRPADYDFRCLNALNAERPADAGVLAVQALLQRDRDGARRTPGAPAYINDAIENAQLGSVLTLLQRARSCLVASKFAECGAILENWPHGLPKALDGEREYLYSRCLLSTRNSADHEAARHRLSKWTDYIDEEPELGLRLSRLLHHGLTLSSDKTQARALGDDIQRRLEDRARFDTRALDEIYSMDRSASAVYPPDVALPRVKEAADYFGRGHGEETFRRPIEYYRCLINLTAVHITVGRYEAANETYERLIDLIDTFVAGTFDALGVAHSNGLLAQYRTGRVTPLEAARRQRAIMKAFPAEDDPFFAGNALGAYLALGGDLRGALEVYDDLAERLRDLGPNPQPTVRYFVGANRYCVQYLLEDVDDVDEWSRLAAVVPTISYPIRPYLERRHELLSEFLSTGARLSPQEFDLHLTRTHPDEFGPLWDNFSRGFRLPEIELWSE